MSRPSLCKKLLERIFPDMKDLPKRARYYQSMIDLQLIDRGEHYKNLNRSYVIFICTEDVFHKGRHKYTFQNVCREDAAIDLGDETTKIFLNTKGTMDDIDTKLKAVLDYIDGVQSEDPYVEELDHAVMEAKRNREWRREYMTLAMKLSESYDKGLEKGRTEGIKNIITALRDLGIAEPIIQRELQEKYELTKEQIKAYF